MAWIYLAASADSPLPYLNGLNQSPIVKTIDTHKESCSPVNSPERCRSPQSGMTCVHCLEVWFRQLTLYMGGSPVRILVRQAMVKAWRESEAVYFSMSKGWLATLSPDSYFWKTCRQFGQEEGTLSPRDWPSSGMIVGGACYRLPTSALRTKERDGSFSPVVWATPTTKDRVRSEKFRKGRLPTLAEGLDGTPNPGYVEWLMGYPHGWTVLRPLVMQWFQNKQEKRL